MPTTTVTQQGYEIREGLSGPVDAKHPFIEANAADGHTIVTAIEYTPRDYADDPGRPYWLLIPLHDLRDAAGIADRPDAVRCEDADHARVWVNLLATLYVKAARR